jgi:hypothetical protein
VDRSTVTDQAGDDGAVYKGLDLVTTPAGKFLYAANFLGQLQNPGGPITISGLWGLRFLRVPSTSPPNALHFTAGLNDEADGLLGNIVPAQS